MMPSPSCCCLDDLALNALRALPISLVRTIKANSYLSSSFHLHFTTVHFAKSLHVVHEALIKRYQMW